MIPRKRIDIGWADLAYGVAACFVPAERETAQRRLESVWNNGRASLACLSVRSGFDALLGALKLPPGSEIAVSAINIGDMARIIEAHELVAVPVDLDMQSLAVSETALERALSERTRAVLIAHLFGSRMPMADVVRVARARGLVVIEDCAQAYRADAYRGHPDSDVSMFSFGPIKTATALAGGMFSFRDPELCERVRGHQARWPVQSRARYLLRPIKYALLVLLSGRALFAAFVALCRACGTDHERVLGASVRGFAGGDFFRKIRCRPSFPLLALLERRISRFDGRGVARRVELAKFARRLMPRLETPGACAADHSYWVFPVRHRAPDLLMQHLWRKGFDATRGATSLCAFDPPPDRDEPADARRALEEVLYLPVYAGMSERDVERLAAAVAEFDAVPAARSKATPSGNLTRREGAARLRNAAKR